MATTGDDPRVLRVEVTGLRLPNLVPVHPRQFKVPYRSLAQTLRFIHRHGGSIQQVDQLYSDLSVSPLLPSLAPTPETWTAQHDTTATIHQGSTTVSPEIATEGAQEITPEASVEASAEVTPEMPLEVSQETIPEAVPEQAIALLSAPETALEPTLQPQSDSEIEVEVSQPSPTASDPTQPICPPAETPTPSQESETAKPSILSILLKFFTQKP